MGLFDSVTFYYPLPDPGHQQLVFQTKDLGCMMCEYAVRSDGSLVRQARRTGRPTSDEQVLFHGDLILLGSTGDGEIAGYKARFTHGLLEWVARRQARSGSAPDTFAADLESEEREIDWDPAPALEGRPVSPSEFASHAPERLSLVDGRVVGADSLLWLLLTNVGLRRAVRLVGAAAWSQAIEGAR